MIGHRILFALWLFWPAGIATLLPVLAAHVPLLKRWNTLMDFGRSWQGRRLLGDHKTWRGFLAGWLGGSIWAWTQSILYQHSTFIQGIYPAGFNSDVFIWVGIVVSLGAVFGDAVGSFAKRQLDIPSGESWFPWDQLDFIFGGLLLSLLVVRLPWQQYLIIPAVWLCIHLLFGFLGFITKLKPAAI
jgi:CDP-2,3-bis-(O-geranylgeranyl)-sn-glycerol synthase